MSFTETLGIGFGPANLALAIALKEQGDGGSARFVERQSGFGWHQGMLLEDATLQVSFLKDLVTMRNPRSQLTFVNYLHGKGRLVDFINARTFYPLRVEYNDYLTWAASHVSEMVDYSSEAITVDPIYDGSGNIVELELVVRDSVASRRLRTRNLVLGMGSAAKLPAGVCSDGRIRHSSQTLQLVDDLRGKAKRLVVVGSGQSAAEVAAYFHRSFPDAEVYAVMSRFGYSVADDSAFTNRIFDPASVSTFYEAPPPVRTALLAYHANTNYSVVDADLIADLFRRVYRERVTGKARLHVMNTSRVNILASTTAGIDVEIVNVASGGAQTVSADAIVFATGYKPIEPLAILGELANHCTVDDLGRPRIGRDFRILTDDRVHCAIYLQGPTEYSHGLSSTLLSNSAVRAGEIAGSIQARADRSELVRR